jgi:hypothetical protein
MLSGDRPDVEEVRPLLGPMCRETIVCGLVPQALYMKLAVNLFGNALVACLAEAVHFAARHDLDLEQFLAVLDAGPMASSVSRVKGRKLATGDFAVQARRRERGSGRRSVRSSVAPAAGSARSGRGHARRYRRSRTPALDTYSSIAPPIRRR